MTAGPTVLKNETGMTNDYFSLDKKQIKQSPTIGAVKSKNK